MQQTLLKLTTHVFATTPNQGGYLRQTDQFHVVDGTTIALRDGPLEKLWGGGVEANFRAAGIFVWIFFRP